MTNENLFAEIRANTVEQIKTCRFIETRMVDQYVLAMPDGAVLHTSGIHGFPVQLDKVQRTRDKARIQKLLDQVRADNPDNSAVQALKIMGWKKAARLQREVAERILETLDAKAL